MQFIYHMQGYNYEETKIELENLIKQIHRFESSFWPDHKHLNEPPAEWDSELRKHLFRAFHFGITRELGEGFFEPGYFSAFLVNRDKKWRPAAGTGVFLNG